MTQFTDDDLKRLKEGVAEGHEFWANVKGNYSYQLNIESLLARLEAAEFCASCLDANSEVIEENTDEDDVALMNQGLKAWRASCGK